MTGTTEQKPPPSDGETKKRFILLADGNARDLFSTGMLLQRLEYDVYMSSSAEDAFVILAAGLPALIISDLALPRQSGLDFITQVKAEGRTQGIPIIVHTAVVDPELEARCQAGGCASYLRKPVEPGVLYRAVQHAMESTPRQYIRLKTFLWAFVGGQPSSGGAVSAEFVTALSENGVYVQTLGPRPIKSIQPVSMIINERQINVRAVVLYCYGVGSGPFKEPGMGMKFVEIADADRSFIKDFITEQLTQDITSQRKPV